MELLHEVTKDDRNVSPNNSALLEKERELQKKKKGIGAASETSERTSEGSLFKNICAR